MHVRTPDYPVGLGFGFETLKSSRVHAAHSLLRRNSIPEIENQDLDRGRD